MVDPTTLERLRGAVGPSHVRADAEARAAYANDALRQGVEPDVVVWPGSTAEVAAIARACQASRTPLVPRGAGTGYTGGAVPVRRGVVLSLERLDRILEIDEANLLAVVEPHVVTGTLQEAVERVGLFYPPDPASLRESVIGGNVAECAGGPRAFKYGVTREYVLGLEAVLPTGEVIRTGGRTVKNVVGYDLTRLLVGSEGTLAIITQIILRLVPRPPARATIRATFGTVADAMRAVSNLLAARVVPATLEFVDGACLEAVARHTGGRVLAAEGAGALLLLEVDGLAEQVAAEADLVEGACRGANATELRRATAAADREELWRVRRELSPALRTIAPVKINHDVVVPRARVAALLDHVDELARRHGVVVPCFGHAGDGNIHVNVMVPDEAEARSRAAEVERAVFARVIALGGSISGEHGIGFAKAPFLGLELTAETIDLMRRIKQAFDPAGILNPGKIFPPSEADA